MEKREKTLSVLVVSFNTCELTLECLRSIYRETRSVDYDVIVVDNASIDGSAEAIGRELPQVALIRLSENVGFARANNIAAKCASGRFLLLLNPDTEVLDCAIDRLHAFATANPDAGIWGGRTVFADLSLNPTSCWRFMSIWSVLLAAIGMSGVWRSSDVLNPDAYGAWPRDSVREVDIITGCFLLIDRALWDRLGGFDECFFMYGEEADLCYRARQLGARPLFTPDATIVHYDGASEVHRSDKLIRLLAARITFMAKHWTQPRRAIGMKLIKMSAIVRMLRSRLRARLTGSEVDRAAAAEWQAVWVARDRWARGYARQGETAGDEMPKAGTIRRR